MRRHQLTRNPFPGRGVAAALLTALLLCGGVAAGPAGAAAPTLPPTTTAPTGAIPTPGPLHTLTSSASTAARTSEAARPTSSRPSVPVAAPAASSGPQLSIAVDNGRTSAAPGQVLDYVLTLTNLGSSEVKGLRVTQSVPAGLTLVKADGGGQAKNGNVGWKVDLAAAKATTFHVRMKVSATPKELLRLATVACAGLASKTAPIVCASHSDQLPAGAAATSSAAKPTVAQAASPAISSAHRSWGTAIIIAVTAGALVILLLILTVAARRRRTTTTATN